MSTSYTFDLKEAMAIFPSDMPDYLNDNDRDILTRMEKFYADAITMNISFWAESDLDTRFTAGDATLWSEIYNNIPNSRRRNFNFNRIRRVIDMVDGYQRRNRKSTVVIPVENGNEETADQFTKVMMWLNRTQNINETISDSFRGGLITGLNLLHVWVDYRNDPISGDIRVDNTSYNAFMMDPYWRKQDLSDCQAIWKRTYVTKRECISLLPDKKEEIEQLHGVTNKDGKFKFQPETYNFGGQNLLTYDEFYYRDYRTQKQLVDTKTGEVMEWKSDDADALERFMRLYPEISIIETEVPTVKLAIVVQGRVMYHGGNLLGIDEYPFVPVVSYHLPELPYYPWRLQGMTRGLRDSQYLYNRRKIIELDIMESQLNSGWIFKENAPINPEDLFRTGQGQVVGIKADANINDVIQIQAPALPQSMIELSKSLADEIQQISGVSEELLGSAIDDKAGVLAMMRQGAGLTTLQGLFDKLDLSVKLLGKIILKVVQQNFAPGKIKRIIEGEPSQEFYNKTYGLYDVAIEEGYDTTTQRQLQFAQITQLRELGVPIPDEFVLEAATLQNKKKLIDTILQQQQQAQEMQQKQDQLALADMEAKTKLVNAQAAADTGLGIERMSRVQENQALAEERRAKSIHDLDAGALDMVKAIKELQSMDLDRISRAIELISMIKEQTKQENEELYPHRNIGPMGPMNNVMGQQGAAPTNQPF